MTVVCPATITGKCVELTESWSEVPCRGRCARAYLLPGCEDMDELAQIPEHHEGTQR